MVLTKNKEQRGMIISSDDGCLMDKSGWISVYLRN